MVTQRYDSFLVSFAVPEKGYLLLLGAWPRRSLTADGLCRAVVSIGRSSLHSCHGGCRKTNFLGGHCTTFTQVRVALSSYKILGR